MNAPIHEKWLVAAWPGMGAVAQIAAQTLVRQLGAEPIQEIAAQDFFDVTTVPVEKGVVRPPVLPRSTFHAWKDPSPDGRDIVVFIGEQQPQRKGFDFCRALLDEAERLGVTRIHTFAALAAPVHPTAEPGVHVVATRHKLLEEAVGLGCKRFENGELSGLNGVLISAAASREMDGLCLLAEFPFFAAQMPNPKAARAVLATFGELAGLDLDLSELDAQARQVEPRIVALLDAMQAAGQILVADKDKEPDELDEEDDSDGESEPAPEPEAAPTKVLDRDVERRIEELFVEAARDRARAVELKAELDRHGVFKRYEDRFLDLFRQAG